MRSKKLTEEEAFKLIQRQSMDLRKSMREIAEAVLLAGELDQRVEKHRGYIAALHASTWSVYVTDRRFLVHEGMFF